MATVHIRDIGCWLDSQDGAEKDSKSFLEIRFDEPAYSREVPDAEMSNKVITADSPQGIVTITWDAQGVLRSLDIS